VAVAATAVGPGGTVVVGIGGTACTDGGWGAFEAVRAAGGLHGASLVGAVDVSVPFVDAARRFGPQKGATPAQVVALADRLEDVAGRYRRTRGVDVADVPGAGAGGGLGGAVLALGGQLVPGVEVVAEQVGLDRALDGADLVVTGEGQLDGTSFAGKVVGSVLDRAGARGLAAVAVVGRATADGRGPAEALGARVFDLSELVGPVRARGEAVASVTEAVTRLLRERG
jgi:glycerate kinase